MKAAKSDSLLAMLVKNARKALDRTDICVGGDSLPSDVSWLSTGNPLIDYVIGGGVPIGRIVEVYGESSHGKSTLALALIAAIQQLGGYGVYLDSEGTWDKARAAKAGIQEGRLVYDKGSTVEDVFTSVVYYLREFTQPSIAALPKIFVWDTLAQTPTRGEVNAELDPDKSFSNGMMDKPRKIRAGIRLINGMLLPAQACMIVVNQPIADPGKFSMGKTTPGPGVHFAASARLNVIRVGKLEEGGKQVGIISKIKSDKNKMTSPNRDVELAIRYDSGIDVMQSLVNWAVKQKDDKLLAVYPGGWYQLAAPEPQDKMRLTDLVTLLKSNAALADGFASEVGRRLKGDAA